MQNSLSSVVRNDVRVAVEDVWNVKLSRAATRRVIALTIDPERDEDCLVTFYTDAGEGYALHDGFMSGYYVMPVNEFILSVENKR